MTLTAKDVAEIMRLLEDSSFDALDLELDGLKLSIRRGPDGGVHTTDQSPADTSPPPIPQPERPAVQDSALSSTASDDSHHAVRSPLLGTCYRAPRPGAPPFVEVGSTVEEDTVILIVEVMKLMNTVRAGRRGTITEILVEDGTLVEYDQPLVRIRMATA